ncbi:MAG: hypothetical protein P8J27_13345 [Mariniblastus sp.]|nr:hypothetical protein [Mariniblastus sp.]
MRNQINGLLLAVIVINTCALVGCHRGYYRRQADMEARRLIQEKAIDPRWDSSNGSIEVDPQSRMFNPFSEDHPPIPPDDATSHQFMHCVDGKEGYPHWHANGDTNYVESPTWKSYLPTNEQGQVILNLERAYQLALIHSPALQRQRETLYLSALDVSLERFGFDTQLFAGFNSFFTNQGQSRGGNSSNLQNQLGVNGGGIDFRRAGITGANFAVGLANTILFNFAGADTQSATSLIDFSVIQPLLRGAGRERILESLTQAERTLLANVRQMERFRRGFYLTVAVGRNAGAGPNRSGNFLNLSGSAGINAAGFYGLLQNQQQIRNQEFNVRQFEAVLEQFREFFDRERLDAVDLKSFETRVYTEQRRLLQLKTGYQTSLDQFKSTLGLPPDLEVVIDDPSLDQFELISDQINERLISIGDLRKETGEGLNKVYKVFEDVVEKGTWENFQWPDDLADRIENLGSFVDLAESTLERITTIDREQVEADLRKLEAKRTSREAYLEKIQQEVEDGKIISNVDPKIFQPESILKADELYRGIDNPELDEQEFIMIENRQETPQRSIMKRATTLKADLKNVQNKIAGFREVEKTLGKTPQKVGDIEIEPPLYRYILNEFQQTIPGYLSELNNLALELSLVQARARSNSIEIVGVDLNASQTYEIARCMRRDLMNARASLVDQWRNIEFVADQLEAQVDLVFQGGIGNEGDNPFNLSHQNGQLRAGFRFDAPITRMSERNQYRSALISYQQSKRSFYQFEDSVKQTLRNLIRNANQSKVLFELDKLSIQVAIENVEVNRYALDQPVRPGASARLGPETSRNLSQAITSLNSAQNSFLGTWVRFEVIRRNLDFDMGTMQLDEVGAWIDPGKLDAGIGARAAAMMGIQLDCQFCDGVGDYSFDTVTPMSDNSNIEPTAAPRPQLEQPLGNAPKINGTQTPRATIPPASSPEIRGFRTSSLKGSSLLQDSNQIPRNLFRPMGLVATPKDDVVPHSAEKMQLGDTVITDPPPFFSKTPDTLETRAELAKRIEPTTIPSSFRASVVNFEEDVALGRQGSNLKPIQASQDQGISVSQPTQKTDTPSQLLSPLADAEKRVLPTTQKLPWKPVVSSASNPNFAPQTAPESSIHGDN